MKIEDCSDILGVSQVIPGKGYRAEEPEGHFNEGFMEMVAKEESKDFPGIFDKDVAIFSDPRLKELGSRIIAPSESFEVDSSIFEVQEEMAFYNFRRIIFNVLEGQREMEGKLPLNLLLDHLNTVSFSKGCYIG